MAFNSLIFLMFFAIVLGLHQLPLAWRAKKVNLLLASYIFYAAWNPPFILLLWISTLTDWFAARRIAVTSGGRKFLWLILSVLVNLLMLGYFKYGAFLEANLAALLQLVGVDYAVAEPNIILPLGISFYTFQSMSYSIDVYRGKQYLCKSLSDFALYVSFFPQLVAGPILRAGFFLQQLAEDYAERVTQLGWGFALITVGMFEKVVLADGLLAPVVEKVYASSAAANGVDAWLGTMAFAGQIFFDFNGYSVIAVGLGCCLGFKFPWNFLSPYAAVGFADFWRRWHITLSTWLRDYVYIPLAGNRVSTMRTFINLMLTMLLGGLWHGASWLFVLWGAVHGTLLVAERLIRNRFGGAPLLQTGTATFLLGLVTWLIICLTWVLFRAESPQSAAELLTAMLSLKGGESLLSASEIVQVAMVVGALLTVHGIMRDRNFEQTARSLSWPLTGLLLAAMLIAILLSPGEERAFIYFEF
ncbi:MAG: MBOAT family protein [Gammaproteobacteria bacterium]|nr:MBOAT family protein [Gammaproteobacteria bacterium]